MKHDAHIIHVIYTHVSVSLICVGEAEHNNMIDAYQYLSGVDVIGLSEPSLLLAMLHLLLHSISKGGVWKLHLDLPHQLPRNWHSIRPNVLSPSPLILPWINLGISQAREYLFPVCFMHFNCFHSNIIETSFHWKSNIFAPPLVILQRRSSTNPSLPFNLIGEMSLPRKCVNDILP